MLTEQDIARAFRYCPVTGLLTWAIGAGQAKPGKRAGRVMRCGYRGVTLGGREYLEHRLIWRLMTGAWPESQIDHVNMNRADNRWENLRPATNAQQQANTSRTARRNKFGHKGIYWDADRSLWRSQINVNGRPLRLGRFKTKDEAILAYREAAVAHYGEFVRFE
jgi:hypothetical protein